MKTILECLQVAQAQDFVIAIPIDVLGQQMSPMKYRTILGHRLMIPLFPIDEVCLVCCKACLDIFEKHVVHCKELPDFKYIYDFVKNLLFDIFSRARVPVKKEVYVNFLTYTLDRRSTLRYADVMMYGWVGGKHACFY